MFDYFKLERHLEIPFNEDTRHQFLGCQLEQFLLAEDCGRVGDSVGEAQHGQTAGHIGIFSASLPILRWAATPPHQAADTIQIENQDIHLAEIIMRLNLLLKKKKRIAS